MCITDSGKKTDCMAKDAIFTTMANLIKATFTMTANMATGCTAGLTVANTTDSGSMANNMAALSTLTAKES